MPPYLRRARSPSPCAERPAQHRRGIGRSASSRAADTAMPGIRRVGSTARSANCLAGRSVYSGIRSNHSLLAFAARCSGASAVLRRCSYASSAAGRGRRRVASASASAMASCIASLVPEPMAKWVVCAASPISTRLPWSQRRLVIRRKLSQPVLPTSARWSISGWPSRCAAKISCRRAQPSLRVQVVQPQRRPGLRRALHDERAGVRVERVGVEPDPAGLGLLETEGERVEDVRRAQPDVLVAADVDVRAEVLGVPLADPAAGAVAGDHQVGVQRARTRRSARSR